eukprot:2351021-Rhodomonas_salina.1
MRGPGISSTLATPCSKLTAEPVLSGHAGALQLILAHPKANPGAKEGEALVVAAAQVGSGLLFCVEQSR